MTLPKINHPIYEVYLKSLDKKVKFRPFLVKEEKLFLIARESDDAESLRVAINQIIQNCCIDSIDVHSLPVFDVEMFFIHLRAKSIGEIVPLEFTCNNVLEDGTKCGFVTEYPLNLEKINYSVPEGHSNVIDLGGGIGVKLKYPTFDTLIYENEDEDISGALQIVLNNLDYIYDEQSIYKTNECSTEELTEFLDSLSADQIQTIRNFFRTLPKVIIDDEIECGKCKFKHRLKSEGISDFFI